MNIKGVEVSDALDGCNSTDVPSQPSAVDVAVDGERMKAAMKAATALDGEMQGLVNGRWWIIDANPAVCYDIVGRKVIHCVKFHQFYS